jgi:hypothetical protein
LILYNPIQPAGHFIPFEVNGQYGIASSGTDHNPKAGSVSTIGFKNLEDRVGDG